MSTLNKVHKNNIYTNIHDISIINLIKKKLTGRPNGNILYSKQLWQ